MKNVFRVEIEEKRRRENIYSRASTAYNAYEHIVQNNRLPFAIKQTVEHIMLEAANID